MVYFRCNSGHYFRASAESGDCCPLDGWSLLGLEAVRAAEASLVADGKAVTIEALRAGGAPGGALQRTLLVEFGSDDSVFEALSPEGFVLDGRFVTLVEAPPSLK